MTRDILDDLLDRSVPASPHVPPAEFRAMAGDARTAAPRSRRPRVWLTAGMVVALFAGGTGAAYAATGGFSWKPWAQDPVSGASFTMSNGFRCEIRETKYTGGADPAFIDRVNGILEDWYRSGAETSEARAFVPAELAKVPFAPNEAGTQHGVWGREWDAWDLAISEAEGNELARHGIQPGDTRFDGAERASQIQCDDANGKLYVPKAGA